MSTVYVVSKPIVVMELTIEDAKKLKQLLSLSGFLDKGTYDGEDYTYEDVELTSTYLHSSLKQAIETTSNP